jgi:hypothetical protein
MQPLGGLLVTKAKKPKYPLRAYAGRSLGEYAWFTFHAASGLHFLRTLTFPEKWIRLTDAAWERDDALFGLERGWFYCPGRIAVRAVNPYKPRTPKRKPPRKPSSPGKITTS